MNEARYICTLILLLNALDGHSRSPNSCATLYLLQVVPFHTPQEDGWDRGLEVIPAGRVALRHINSHPDLLDGLQLEIINVPSNSCAVTSPYVPFVELMRMVTSSVQECVFGVIGLYCSSVTIVTVPPFSHPKFGFVQLTTATSPVLLNTDRYPYLFKTVSSTEVYVNATIKMMDYFEWMRISVVFDYSQIFFRTTGMSFSRSVESNPNFNRTVQIPLAEGTLMEIQMMLQLLFNRASRAAFFSVTIEESGMIICEAYRLKHTWPWFAYIFADRTLEDVLSYNGRCTPDEMKSAVEGVFFLQTKLSIDNETSLVSGKSYREYYEDYLEELRKESEARNMTLSANEYANSLYDQVWAFALAVNASLENVNTAINNSFISASPQFPAIREELTDALQKVMFQGASGIINFGNRQEALSCVDILQVRNGTMVTIAEFDSYNQRFTFSSSFQKDEVPPDSFDIIPFRIPWIIGAITVFLQGILITVILISMLAIVYWRKQPEIKSTSLYISFVILIGCLLLALAPISHAILYVFDIPQEAFSILCNVDLWFSLCGITLIVVALLFRLLRIAHVFSSYRSTGKHWSDKFLILYITTTSCVILLFLIIWFAVDPVHFFSIQVYQSSAVPPFFSEYRYCKCRSLGIWLAVALAWIGLLMCTIVLLAIQTRKIKRKHFKDTKKVNFFIFSSCIIYTLFVPLSYLLQAINYHLIGFLFNQLSYFAIVLLCQLLLFLPKYVPLLNKKKTKQYSVSSALGQFMRSMDSATTSSTQA